MRQATGMAAAWLLLIMGSTKAEQWTVGDYHARLGQGVNFGNTLESPREGDWGYTLEAEHFQIIAKAGFDSVRIPIRWSSHAGEAAPYTIDAQFLERIDWVVQQAEQSGLAAILNVHHYDELHGQPAEHRERFLALWQQIADHYKDASDNLYFELLNEPHDQLDAEQWNQLASEALKVVRAQHPRRPVVIGGVSWNSGDALSTLKVPADDRNVILTFHYYLPFEFTHQGADWVGNSSQWLGKDWQNRPQEEQAIRADFDRVRQVAEQQGRPVLLGEFGVYSAANMDSRARWTKFVAATGTERHFALSYWEFGSGFGLYDLKQKSWHQPLRDALSPVSMFDINRDHQVDRSDFSLLQTQLAQKNAAGDLNHDGKVSERDLKFWSYFAGPRAGDFSRDGKWQADDIDTLTVAVRQHSTDRRYDLNDDGAINNDDRKYWVETIVNTYFGDANLDGQFGSDDMVLVYQSSEYEDDVAGNSTWVEGDWDGDGEFDSSDLVIAFGSGALDKGPRTNTGQ